MWLWPLWVVLGFGEPWSVGCSCLLGRALLADVRLLAWVGTLKGGVEPREKPVPLPLFRRSPAFGSMCSQRALTPVALCSELFCCFQNQPFEGGSTASSCLQMLVQCFLVPAPPGGRPQGLSSSGHCGFGFGIEATLGSGPSSNYPGQWSLELGEARLGRVLS